MSTTLFPTRSNNTGFFPTLQGGWHNTSGTGFVFMTPLARTEMDFGWGNYGAFEVSATSLRTGMCVTGISAPLAGSGTLAGTLDVILAVKENAAGADMFFRVHAWISVGNTSVVRGTLISTYEETTPNEWPTTATGKAFAAPIALSSVAYSAGDRIVIEIGWIARNAVSTFFRGDIYAGVCEYDPPYAPLTTALGVGDTPAGASSADWKYGSVTFSDTIAFSVDPGYPDPPANDDCSAATNITSTPFSDSVFVGGATTEGSEPQSVDGSGSDGKGVWWKWTAPANDPSCVLDVRGSTYSYTVSVWTGTCGAFTQHASDTDSDGVITFAASIGVTYYFLLQRYFGGSVAGETADLTFVPSLGGALPLDPGSAGAFALSSTTIRASASDATQGTAPYTYQWYRGTTAGFTLDGSSLRVGATSLVFDDTSVLPNTQYYYVLRYTDAAAAVVDSNEAGAIINIPLTVPTLSIRPWIPPAMLTPIARKLTLSWVHSGEGMGGGGHYEIESCTGMGCSGFTSMGFSLPGGTFTKDFGPTSPTVAPDTIYRYRIRAVGNGNGPWSPTLEYLVGKTVSASYPTGDDHTYWPGEVVSQGNTSVLANVTHPIVAVPTNAIIRVVRISVCAKYDTTIGGGPFPAIGHEMWEDGSMGMRRAVPGTNFNTITTANASSSFGASNGGEQFIGNTFGAPATGTGLYCGATQPTVIFSPVRANWDSAALSQAEMAGYHYGWVGLRDHQSGFAPGPGAPLSDYWYWGVEIDEFRIEVQYDLEGSEVGALITPPPDDESVPSCCDTPGSSSTGEEPTEPTQPWTQLCLGGGAVPIAAALMGGEVWL